MRKLAGTILLVATLTVGISACSAADVKQSKFESELVDKTQLTKTQATCVGDQLYKQFDQKTINKLYSADKEEDLPTGVSAKFQKIITDCVTAG